MKAIRIKTIRGIIIIPVGSTTWIIPARMSGRYQKKIQSRLKGFNIPKGATIHFAKKTNRPYLINEKKKSTLERETTKQIFIFNDGGRSAYFEGMNARDCVPRAIAIATKKDYKEVYNDMAIGMKKFSGKKSARNGVNKKVYHNYILDNGFEWIPTMQIGSGCKVHLHKDELPKGVLIVKVSHHLTCVIDGVINDTYNPQKGSIVGIKDGVSFTQIEKRCVYGYYQKIK